MPSFERSQEATGRLADLIPGGAHTYAKGEDQYPENLAPVMARGLGAHVWDVDGNEYIEYGSGLRAVVLGHARPEVVAAARKQLELGENFVRPSIIELEAAQEFLRAVPGAQMVKFAKNGSDVTTAAIKLARAATGRELVAICSDQPFFSTDDWFIGATPMAAGVPRAISDLSIGFPYGDLPGTEAVLRQHAGQVSCLILEAATAQDPPDGYLEGLKKLAHEHGALLIFDEMINGFRLSPSGAQGRYGVVPDLSTFGKALGNGLSVSALAGRREYLELGGLRTQKERVFLLSTTHGAEAHALAAAIAVMQINQREDIPGQLRGIGERLREGVAQVTSAHGISDRLFVRGHPENLVYVTLDADGQPSQEFRTLFMRQLILGGVIGPSFVVSTALSESDIERTLAVLDGACVVYRRALEAGEAKPWTGGRPVKPVFRSFA